MKRILTQAFAALGMLLMPTIANAYTVDELCDYAWIATYRTTPNFNPTTIATSPIIDSHGVTAERVDATHIRLNNIMGCLDFILTLTDSRGVATDNGDYLQINVSDYAVNVSSSDYSSQQWQMLQCVQNGVQNNVTQYKRTSDDLLFSISQTSDGFKILSTTPVFIHGSGDVSPDYLIRIFDQMELVSFEPNASATDTFTEMIGYSNYQGIYNISAPRSREYPLRVELDYTNKRFTILNFGNNGYGIRENKRYYSNLYNNSSITTFTDGKFIIGGTFNPTTRKMTFDKNQFAKPIWAPYVYNSYYGIIKEDLFSFQLERFDPNNTVDELFGEFDDTKDLRHNNAPTAWVTHGGKRRTIENLVMEVEDYTYYLNKLLFDRINLESTYTDNEIIGADVTLHTRYVKSAESTLAPHMRLATSDPLAHVEYTQFNAGNDADSRFYDGTPEWGVVPVMKIVRNEQYADSYEIMAVPGTYTTAAQVEAHLDQAVTFRRVFLNNGQQLTQTDNSPVFAADKSKNGVYKPGDFRMARNNNDSDPYTFFIKVNYKPETDLTPTYHDIYPYTFTSSLPTAVETVTVTDADVKGEYGAITINGISAKTTVYNAAGTKVYTGTCSRIELPAGVYIVTIAGKNYKVNVR